MQGGHRDGLNKALGGGGCDKKDDAPLDVAYDSVNEISLSRTGDTIVESFRRLWIFLLATPVAWAHMEPSVKAFRQRKFRKVRTGTKTVLEVQRRCRTPFLDIYFAIWSFFAEEEFYLIVIPACMWNIDYVYARHLNFVTCSGLLVGNTLKDVFKLPRPKNVWRPSTAELTDSTAMRDFGYPSTHAMNALSNTLLTILYCYCPVATYKSLGFTFADDVAGWTFPMGLMIAMIWFFSITFGRLYLGAHTPTDVRGGLILGLFFGVFWWYVADAFDRLILSIPHVGLLILFVSALVLMLNPQPRPMTPTFLQNCLLIGLLSGSAIGFRMEMDRSRQTAATVATPDVENHGRNIFLRILIGYTAVLVARQILKVLLTTLLRCIGVDPSPNKTKKQKNDERNKDMGSDDDEDAWGQHVEVDVQVPRILRGWDLWGAAFLKFFSYSCLAWLITCGCPWAFEVMGIHTKLTLITAQQQ
jgi:membrane-associated phospholipid phosphatase